MPRPVKDGPLRVGDRTVQVPIVAKPFFPDAGLVKGDLVAYDRSPREREVVMPAGGVLHQLKEVPGES